MLKDLRKQNKSALCKDQRAASSATPPLFPLSAIPGAPNHPGLQESSSVVHQRQRSRWRNNKMLCSRFAPTLVRGQRRKLHHGSPDVDASDVAYAVGPAGVASPVVQGGAILRKYQEHRNVTFQRDGHSWKSTLFQNQSPSRYRFAASDPFSKTSKTRSVPLI